MFHRLRTSTRPARGHPAWRLTVRLMALVLVTLPVLAGCNLLAARSDSRYTVEMSGQNRFSPGTIDIPLGATVVWINRGSLEHTTTADPSLAGSPESVVLPEGAAPWNSGGLGSGQTWERVFDVPGTYVYFCQRHESDGMIGSITVTG